MRMVGSWSWILLRPLGPTSFRWGGITSPFLRGSMSGAIVSPLPLPSTLEGFLRSSLFRVGVLKADEVADPGALPKIGVRLGPAVLYLRFGEEERFCVNAYGSGGRLVCGGSDLEPLPLAPLRSVRIGVALDRAGKGALEGYLYSMEQVDLRPSSLLRAVRESGWKWSGIDASGIAVRVSMDEDILRRLAGIVGPLGGEGAPVRVEGELGSEPSGNSCALASPALVSGYRAGAGLEVTWDSGS
ncbi:MAG: hypothetical protein ACP5ID_06505, partial [Conexivisphaera sp.]